MAFATGVLLLVLVFVAMPLKYLRDDDTLVALIGPLHGWLYLAYVITAWLLANQAGWGVLRRLLVVLAGTVPFASFVAERAVVRAVRARERERELSR